MDDVKKYLDKVFDNEMKLHGEKFINIELLCCMYYFRYKINENLDDRKRFYKLFSKLNKERRLLVLSYYKIFKENLENEKIKKYVIKRGNDKNE